MAASGDGDLFGFTYAYPGRTGRYKAVDEATRAFFSVYSKAVEMNADVKNPDRKLEPGEELGEQVPLTPDQIENVAEMNSITLTVKQHFQSRFARSDVRLAKHKEKTTVYDDDNVTLIVPLTYSAAVKFGNDFLEAVTLRVQILQMREGFFGLRLQVRKVAFSTRDVALLASRFRSDFAGVECGKRLLQRCAQ